MAKQQSKSIPGRHGGTLTPMQPGAPALPGAGRPKNPFKEAIRKQAEGGQDTTIVDGFLVVAGQVTSERVKVQITLPSAEAVVVRMFRQAAKKGDVAAARWLAETGFGKTINIEDEAGNSVFTGFKFVVEDRRQTPLDEPDQPPY